MVCAMACVVYVQLLTIMQSEGKDKSANPMRGMHHTLFTQYIQC